MDLSTVRADAILNRRSKLYRRGHQDALGAAERLFSAIDAILPAGAANSFGAWSIVDTDLALMLNRLVMNGDAAPKWLADYARTQWQRPNVHARVRMNRLPRP